MEKEKAYPAATEARLTAESILYETRSASTLLFLLLLATTLFLSALSVAVIFR